MKKRCLKLWQVATGRQRIKTAKIAKSLKYFDDSITLIKRSFIEKWKFRIR